MILILMIKITRIIIINILSSSMYEEYQQSSISDQYDMRHHEVKIHYLTNKGVLNIAVN